MPIYTFPQSEPNFGETFVLNLEANRVKLLEAYGRTCVCINSGATFKMAFNNGKYFDMAEGARWELQDNERFNTLKLLSTVAQTVLLVVGNLHYEAPRNIIVAPTRAFPGAASTLAAGATMDLTAIPSGASYRKAIIVTNNDASIDLDIYTQDANGAYQLSATVFHLQAWYAETSDAIRIKNPGGSTVNVRVMELFYLSQ